MVIEMKKAKKTIVRVILFLMVTALFIGNISFAVLAKSGDGTATNILTALSGWVSAIATIVAIVLTIQNSDKDRKLVFKNETSRMIKHEEYKQKEQSIIKIINSLNCEYIRAALLTPPSIWPNNCVFKDFVLDVYKLGEAQELAQIYLTENTLIKFELYVNQIDNLTQEMLKIYKLSLDNLVCDEVSKTPIGKLHDKGQHLIYEYDTIKKSADDELKLELRLIINSGLKELKEDENDG